MEDSCLDERAVRNMVQSGSARLSNDERQDIAYMYKTFQELRDKPPMRYPADAASPTNNIVYGMFPGTADLLSDERNVGGVLGAMAQLQVTNQVMGNREGGCQLATWAGLEAIAKAGDERMRRGIAAFHKLWSDLHKAYGGDRNPLLNGKYCPAHLVNYIDPQNYGAATLAERALFDGVVPMRGTAGQALPFGLNQAAEDSGLSVYGVINDAAARVPNPGRHWVATGNHGATQAARAIAAELAPKRTRAAPLADSVPIETTWDDWTRCGAFKHRFQAAMATLDPIDRTVNLAFLFARVDKPTIKAMIQSDFSVIPVNFIIIRPRMTHDMGGVIVMEGGRRTGETWYGHTHMGAQSTMSHKTVYFNFTFYCRSFIYRPENILEGPAKYYRKSIGGCGHTWWTDQGMDNWSKTNFPPPEEGVRDEPDIYALMGPYTEREHHITPYLDLRGYYSPRARDPTGKVRLTPDGTHRMQDRGAPGFRMSERDDARHFFSCDYYNKRFRFENMLDQEYGLRVLDSFGTSNSLCVRTWYATMAPNGTFSVEHEGLGHHGKRTVGSTEVRDGACVTLAQIRGNIADTAKMVT
jgi:hypothetical protein